MPSLEESVASSGTIALAPSAVPLARPDAIREAAARLLRVEWQVVATIACRVVVIAAGIATSIVTARFLFPAGRGEYFLVLTTAQMLSQFANLGLPSSNTYFVASDRDLFTALFANSVWASFVGVPVIGAVVFAVSALFGWSAAGHPLVWFALGLAPLILFNLLGSNLFVGLGHLGTFNLVQLASAVVLLPMMLGAGYLKAGPTGFLIASLCGWSAMALVLFFVLKRQAVGSLRFRPDVFAKTFSYSTRAYLATLAGFLVLRINVFTLSALAGSEQVGYYSIASQMADAVAILPQSIALVLFPQLIRTGRGRVRATLDNALQTAIVMAAVCAGVWVIAPQAVHLAFGARFDPAVPVIRAMLPGVLLVGVTAIVSQYLAAGGMPISVVATWFGGVMLTAVMGRALVARLGAIGAALTLSVTYGLILGILIILMVRMAARLSRAAEVEGAPCSSR